MPAGQVSDLENLAPAGQGQVSDLEDLAPAGRSGQGPSRADCGLLKTRCQQGKDPPERVFVQVSGTSI